MTVRPAQSSRIPCWAVTYLPKHSIQGSQETSHGRLPSWGKILWFIQRSQKLTQPQNRRKSGFIAVKPSSKAPAPWAPCRAILLFPKGRSIWSLSVCASPDLQILLFSSISSVKETAWNVGSGIQLPYCSSPHPLGISNLFLLSPPPLSCQSDPSYI